MPSNHTEHYNLSQWEPDDKVLHTDFNEDNRVIDAALAAQAAELAKKADASALTSQEAALNKRIDVRNCLVEMKQYDGTGSATNTLYFTAMPYIVHIMGPGMDYHFCVVYGSPKGSGKYTSGGGKAVDVSWAANSMTLSTSDNDISAVCNTKNQRYYVMALTKAMI